MRVDQALEERGVESRLVLQVHDEVLVEVPEDEREVVGPLVVDLMRHAADLDVPLEVNVAWGTTWAEAKGDERRVRHGTPRPPAVVPRQRGRGEAPATRQPE